MILVSAPLGGSCGLGPPGRLSRARVYACGARARSRALHGAVATSPNSRTGPARAREAVTAARGAGTGDRLSQPAESRAASGRWAAGIRRGHCLLLTRSDVENHQI